MPSCASMLIGDPAGLIAWLSISLQRDDPVALFKVGRHQHTLAGTLLNLRAWTGIDSECQAITISEWHFGTGKPYPVPAYA